MRSRHEAREPRAGARAEDRALIAEARAGDPRALRRLLGRVSGPIYRFGRGFCRNADDAEDVMQEVLVSMVRALPSLRSDASLTTWAYTVARRVCARQRRRAPLGTGRHGPETERAPALEEALLATPEPGPSPERETEQREAETVVRAAVLGLSPALREAILLRDLEGLSAREAAAIVRVSERAFKSRLLRARRALRDALAPWFYEESLPLRRAPCADTERLMSRYLEGELDARACASLELHVRGCVPCGDACHVLRRTLSVCKRAGKRPLPAAVRAAVRKALGAGLLELRSARNGGFRNARSAARKEPATLLRDAPARPRSSALRGRAGGRAGRG